MSGTKAMLRRSQRRFRCLRKGHAFQRYLLGAAEIERCRRCGRLRLPAASPDVEIPLRETA
jgi:hypothetical protein